MRLTPYLCLGGVEVSNDARTAAYVNNIGLPGAIMSQDCPCAAYDQGYDLPLLDPAPWYESTRPESADFLGFVSFNSRLTSPHARTITSTQVGGQLDPLRFGTRSVLVTGTMLAVTPRGMAYGERWLAEILTGSPCNGNCEGNDLVYLPACSEDETYDADGEFRTLVNVGISERPEFSNLEDLPECSVQQATFALTSQMPWIYHPTTRCVDEQTLVSSPSCALTTPDWMGYGAFVIEVDNVDTSETTDIVIQGQISLDGSCPVSGLGTSVPPSFTYTIPTLAPEDKIVIDGMRREVRYYDSSAKTYSTGLRYIDLSGPFTFPEVGPCTTMCVTVEGAGGDASVTIDSVLREI